MLQPASAFPNSSVGKWQLECKSEQPEGSPNLQQFSQAMERWKEKSKKSAGDNPRTERFRSNSILPNWAESSSFWLV